MVCLYRRWLDDEICLSEVVIEEVVPVIELTPAMTVTMFFTDEYRPLFMIFYRSYLHAQMGLYLTEVFAQAMQFHGVFERTGLR